jgi:hypothetical protein
MIWALDVRAALSYETTAYDDRSQTFVSTMPCFSFSSCLEINMQQQYTLYTVWYPVSIRSTTRRL